MTEQEAFEAWAHREYEQGRRPRPAAVWYAALAWLRSQGKPVAWMSPGKERLEFSRPDTVYGSHTIPLFLAPKPGEQT